MSVHLNIRHGLLSFSLLTIITIAHSQKSTVAEYQLKAAFLFNFTHFVEWPKGTFASDENPFIIGVLGENPFGNYLEELTKDEKVKGSPIKIEYFDKYDAVNICHILFINKSVKMKPSEIISALEGKPVLTVSDMSDFLEYGGMIRFYSKNNKIEIHINVDAVNSAKLIISSKLLKLSVISTKKKKSMDAVLNNGINDK